MDEELKEQWLINHGFEKEIYNHFEFGEYITFKLKIDDNYSISVNIGKGVKGTTVKYFDGSENNYIPF